ncbi:TRP-domain-containing protein [Aspergillus crustosus]
MRWLLLLASYVFLAIGLPAVAATRLIESHTLNILEPGNFSATVFSARFTPDNQSVALRFVGETLITGYITAEFVLVVYGYEIEPQTINPCTVSEMKGFCPMNAGPLDITISNIPVPLDVLDNIPSVGFSVPDLDATIRLQVKDRDTGDQVTAIEAVVSNGQTVYQTGVGWAVAVIAGLGLVISVAVPIINGYSDAIIQLSTYTLALFGFIQSQAIIGMLAVPLPPIVRSWTQNFQWSMGVVHADFLQTICTWYLRSTGGTPDELLSMLSTRMVSVLKRRDNTLVKRADTSTSTLVVRGLERVAFRAQIEETNLFMTSILLFAFVTLVIALFLTIWKAVEFWPRLRQIAGVRSSIRKGILYRVFFLAFAPICIFSLWEFTQHDSPAEVVVAVVSLISIVGALGWALARVILTQKRAVANLFTDTGFLHKYGFLYIQFNTRSSYFAAIHLGTLFIKALFISFAQSAPTVQAIAFLIIEPSILIATSILRPWPDKKTNGINLTIASISFLNSIFIIFFSNIFDQPKIVSSVMGVVLFVVNALLMLILVLLVLFYSVWALVRARDLAVRYRPTSEYFGFGAPMQSSTRLTEAKEIDELGVTARGG